MKNTIAKEIASIAAGTEEEIASIIDGFMYEVADTHFSQVLENATDEEDIEIRDAAELAILKIFKSKIQAHIDHLTAS